MAALDSEELSYDPGLQPLECKARAPLMWIGVLRLSGRDRKALYYRAHRSGGLRLGPRTGMHPALAPKAGVGGKAG